MRSIVVIDFPITLGDGLLTISGALPCLGTPIVNLFNEGIEAGRRIPRSAAERVPPPATLPATLPAAPAG